MNFTYKQIWRINFPVMMSLLMEQLINITDTIYLGHLGETELAASAIGTIYYLSVYMLGFGFNLGLQVLIARLNGEGKYKDTGKVFFQGLFFLLILAVLLFLITKTLSPFLLNKVINFDDVYEAALKYINWRCFGLLFAFPVLAFRAFFIGITKTRVLTLNSLIMLSVNVVLNHFFIFGFGNISGLGIAGAAIASTLSEFVSLIIFIIYVRNKIDNDFYGFRIVYDGHILVQLLSISLWSMLHSFIRVAPWLLFFIAIEHLGKTQLAIANIVRSVSSVFFVIVNSFSTTTSSLVSNLIGAGNKENVMKLCKRIVYIAYLTGVPLIIIAVVLSDNITGIYTSSRILIDGAFWPYMVMLSNYFFAVPAYVYCNAVSGTGNTKKAFVLQSITIIIYLTYLFFITRLYNIPLAVYWTAEHVFVISIFIQSISYMLKYKWKMKKIIS